MIGAKSNYIGPVDLVSLMEASMKAQPKTTKKLAKVK